MTSLRHVYIHVPFCTRRCSYCDFSIAVRREVPVDDFVRCIVAEFRVRSGGSGVGPVDTLYLGGGTPSKLGPSGIRQLLSGLRDAGLSTTDGAEITIEANPEDLTEESAAALLEAGVNRLSVGIQSFDGGVLNWMHRTHSAARAEESIRSARAAGFGNISLDLIYALPDRLSRRWGDDLRRAIDLAPDHLSVYGLTVEPHTPLGRWTARGTESPQSDDGAAEQFLEAHETLTAAGYEHYEVSNYAKPDGFRSRHNSAYWRRVPYLGLGPSAHSFDGAVRRWNIAAHAAWERAITDGAETVAGTEELDAQQVAAEEAYLGLRTDAGFALSGADADRAKSWVSAGWATMSGGVTRLTAEGWLRLDALAGSLG